MYIGYNTLVNIQHDVKLFLARTYTFFIYTFLRSMDYFNLSICGCVVINKPIYKIGRKF
jgi:hypothetical protein